jgi:cytochrome c-type biogenesis protein CcmH
MPRNLTLTRTLHTLSLLLIAVLLHFSIAAAQNQPIDPAMEKQAEIIFGNTLSPFCPGRLLRDCPSGEATLLKDKIRQRIVAGESPEEIQESIYAEYGDEVRAAPPSTGFGIFAWVTPFLFLLVGFAFTIVWLRSKRSEPESPDPSSDSLDAKTRERIESELSKY